MKQDEGTRALRQEYTQELEQLRLQIEVMSLKVEQALQRAAQVLATGDQQLANTVVESDDEIDEMLVSLTERCYSLLSLQAPVAADLRLIVSTIRILGDLERIGDLCLRVVKQSASEDHRLIARNAETFKILRQMAYEAQDLFLLAMQAWSKGDLRLAATLEERDSAMDEYNTRLMQEILKLDCPDAVPVAIKTVLVGRSLERIADHSVVIGERLRYLLTGNPATLVNEVRPVRDDE